MHGIAKYLFLRRAGFFSYIMSNKMLKRPVFHTLLFIIECTIISYGYVLLHNALSPVDTQINFAKSIYFTAISATTVGYGDHYPIHTITQWYVIVLMIIYLPFRFFYTAGITAYLIKSYRDLKLIGRWFPMLCDHIIIYCNANTIKNNNFLWLERFVAENRRSRKFLDTTILVVNYCAEANAELIQHFAEFSDKYTKTHFANITMDEEGFFQKIHAETAAQIYILADENMPSSDSQALDMMYRLKTEIQFNNSVTIEVINDNNRARFANLGATVLLRPNRSSPEMLVSCTIAPGSAQMLEEIASRGGDSIERFSLPTGDFLWGDLLYTLSMHNIGTATAVIFHDERVDPNPAGTAHITQAKAILVLVHEMRTKSYTTIQEHINTLVHTLVHKKT